MLHISENFSIPDDAITQTFGILAMRGAGKFVGDILRLLVERGSMSKPDLAAAVGKEANNGYLGNTIGAMRTLGLLTRRWPIDVAEEFRT